MLFAQSHSVCHKGPPLTLEVQMPNIKVPRVAKICVICGVSFLCGGRDGPLTKETCSKSCATALKHRRAREAGKPRRNGWEGTTQPYLEPVREPTHDDIVWAAAFYEGEGSCITVKRKYKHKNPGCQCHIGQKDRWPLDKLQPVFGGRVHEATMNGAPFFDWQLHGKLAHAFLEAIYPLVSPRRQEQIRRARGIE